MIQQDLTILIILYQKNINIIRKCLNKLKNLKIIIIETLMIQNLKKKFLKNIQFIDIF